MPSLLLIDGAEHTNPLASNRGLAYGDGLFETIAYNGSLRHWRLHMNRLLSSCKKLHFAPPDPALLKLECEKVIGSGRKAVVKIILTRAVGPRGYTPLMEYAPQRIVQAFPWPEFIEDKRNNGTTLGVCQTSLGRNPSLAGLKHLNRLEQVLGAHEVAHHGWDEGLMLDSGGLVISGTKTNFFFVNKGTIHTPLLTAAGVEGVMKARVLEMASRLGIPVSQRHVEISEVATASEMFLTNAIMGLVWVAKFHHPNGSITTFSGERQALAKRLTASLED